MIAIFIGAGFGDVLRWWLGLTLNSYVPRLPPGTLAANPTGGYIIGLAVAVVANATAIAPEWRPFVITGFCGGLSTFSTFSSELTALLQQCRALHEVCGRWNGRVGAKLMRAQLSARWPARWHQPT